MATTNDEREARRGREIELCSACYFLRAVAITDFYCVSLCSWQTKNMHLCAWEPRFSFFLFLLRFFFLSLITRIKYIVACIDLCRDDSSRGFCTLILCHLQIYIYMYTYIIEKKIIHNCAYYCLNMRKKEQ